MNSLKKILESTPFKFGVPFMGAVFTAVKFGGLVLPQYVQIIAIFGMTLSGLYIIALAYSELLSKISLHKDNDEKKELSTNLSDIKASIIRIEKQLVSPSNNESLPDESLYQALAAKYGYANEAVKIECEIYSDGSARVERQIQVLAFAKYDEIDTYLMVPQMLEKEGSKIQINADVLDASRSVKLKNVKRLLGRTTAELEFFPPLTEGISTTYRIIERTPPNTFILENTEVELIDRKKKGDADEFFGWNINRPTRELIIKIIFPEGFVPREAQSQVRFATAFGFPSIQLQTEEQNRIEVPHQETTSGGRHMAYFNVEFPMTNLIYMLRWLPQLKQDK
ncbi:MAG: hypothetical protein KC421_29670 [Anaerolineales bacterium]|nr:hypothetical protein [Anaerolineales bacterium]